MLVIYGRRGFGRVEQHAGERAQTTFFHIWYLPIVPDTSLWITGGTRGFETRSNTKSILAAYLRTWGAIAGFGLLVSGSIPLMIAGAVLVALSIGAWISGGVRDPRRSDFNRLAFGSRCEPALMLPAMRDGLQTELTAKWATIANGRTPEDVAKYGARSLDEAVLVYGMLRLAEDASADRILAGTYDEAPSDGPYRSDAGVAKPRAIADEVYAKAATLHVGPASATPFAFGIKKLVIGLLFAGVASAALVQNITHLTARPTTSTELVVDERAFVDVQCDSVIDLGSFDGRDLEGYACMLGDKALPVVADHTSATSFVGHVDTLRKEQWDHEFASDPRVLPFTVNEASLAGPRALVICAILYDLVFLGLLGAWLVQWRRKRRLTR